MLNLSVIISARNEFPNVVHTIHSIINDLETFLDKDDFEIILVDNCSTDDRSWRFLEERGMFVHDHVRVLHDPIAGNVSARNKGAKIARGKYIFFSDAHMSYRIGSFKAMIEALDEYGGIVHPAVQWMGGYDPSTPSYQYSIKLGSRVWGTWNARMVSEDPFYIPLSGHCCLGMLKEEFDRFHGYHPMFRCYGGGELYLDLKWWMLGSTSMVVPKALGYHLSAGRGYSYHQDDFIHNIMLMAYALGADAFAERIYINYLGKANKEILGRLYSDALKEGKEDHDWIKENSKLTFDEMITTIPWDKANDKLHGEHNSAMAIFDHTWKDELGEEAKAYCSSSELQKELSIKIARDWSDRVYKPK